MNSLVVIDEVSIRTDVHGRYCLNDLHKAAMANGKATESQRPGEFLKSDPVQAFISILDEENRCDQNRIAQKIGNVQICTSVHSVKGGKSQGTYAVELVAIRYASWIDPSFEVRVYRTFQQALKGKDDWRVSRHASASGYKLASDILKMVRDESGKDTESHHYSNEARLVNWALTGKFQSVDRDALPADQLDLLSYLQERNTVLIGRGIEYDQRKPMVKQYAMDWRMTRAIGATA